MDPTVARIVLIVGRNQRELYTQMRERYGSVARVILDRRYGERRRQVLPVGLERRRRTRQANQSTHLLVIRRGEADVFAWWRARCDEASDTAVIWDRRIGERRTRVRESPVERRARERRRPHGPAWDALGFVLATRAG